MKEIGSSIQLASYADPTAGRAEKIPADFAAAEAEAN